MVRDANVKQAASEKQLKEAQGKVCEVSLKKKNLNGEEQKSFLNQNSFFSHS